MRAPGPNPVTNGSSKSLNSVIIDTFISCFPDCSILKVTLKDISHNYLEDDGNQPHELIIRSEMWIFALQLCIKVGIIGVPGSLNSSSILPLPESAYCQATTLPLAWEVLVPFPSPQCYPKLYMWVHQATCWFP